MAVAGALAYAAGDKWAATPPAVVPSYAQSKKPTLWKVVENTTKAKPQPQVDARMAMRPCRQTVPAGSFGSALTQRLSQVWAMMKAARTGKLPDLQKACAGNLYRPKVPTRSVAVAR